MSHKRQFKHLGARLRAERPSPSSGLISAIVGRLPERVQRHPKASFRVALAAGLAVALVSAVSAVGGVGYAKTQVTHAVVAVKSTVKSPVTTPPSTAVPPLAKSAGKVYKPPPLIRNVRTEPDPTCFTGFLIIKGEQLGRVVLVLIGNDEYRAPFVQQNAHTIKLKMKFPAIGKITVIGLDGIGTYKKEFISKKCVPKEK